MSGLLVVAHRALGKAHAVNAEHVRSAMPECE